MDAERQLSLQRPVPLARIIKNLGLEVISPGRQEDAEVTRGYVSDMLSDVIANAGKDFVWVTMQTHVNVIAVAALKDLAAIVVTGGHRPDHATVEVARTKGLCVLGTERAAFPVAGRLYEMGLR